MCNFRCHSLLGTVFEKCRLQCSNAVALAQQQHASSMRDIKVMRDAEMLHEVTGWKTTGGLHSTLDSNSLTARKTHPSRNAVVSRSGCQQSCCPSGRLGQGQQFDAIWKCCDSQRGSHFLSKALAEDEYPAVSTSQMQQQSKWTCNSCVLAGPLLVSTGVFRSLQRCSCCIGASSWIWFSLMECWGLLASLSTVLVWKSFHFGENLVVYAAQMIFSQNLGK